MKQHVHTMRTGALALTYQCTTCEFQCEPSAVAMVEKNADNHYAVKSTEPLGKVVWNEIGPPERPYRER